MTCAAQKMKFSIKGTAMQTEKALINDMRYQNFQRVSKSILEISHSDSL